LVLLADGTGSVSDYLHTNFKISSKGEAIILTNPTIDFIEQIEVTPLVTDISFAKIGGIWATAIPSPNLSNDGFDLHSIIKERSGGLRYYDPDDWDEHIISYANFSTLPEYLVLNRTEKEKYTVFSSNEEEVKLFEENGFFKIKTKKLEFLTKFKFEEVLILDVYKVSLADEALIIIEWRNRYSVGSAINNINFSVIDLVQKKLSFYSTFNGRASCFTDLDSDDKIDFIKIESTSYYSKKPFENKSTEVYLLNFMDLDGSLKENIKQNIYVIDCIDGYFVMNKKELEELTENPCN